jgi:hypothetical protein
MRRLPPVEGELLPAPVQGARALLQHHVHPPRHRGGPNAGHVTPCGAEERTEAATLGARMRMEIMGAELRPAQGAAGLPRP